MTGQADQAQMLSGQIVCKGESESMLSCWNEVSRQRAISSKCVWVQSHVQYTYEEFSVYKTTSFADERRILILPIKILLRIK